MFGGHGYLMLHPLQDVLPLLFLLTPLVMAPSKSVGFVQILRLMIGTLIWYGDVHPNYVE